ncbi:dimethylamine monooxygenase subunit DmmA family protein [Halalkalibacter alkaliphilus]|uniref:Dimethylamine monooxygenase subunit DmmA-like C-terminal domain-containing protein n=1 Tax=Halalkalibacter alkaliphilus TaxID=2917993 RepID=A0A9X2CUI2_9BACI|nr:dimethylamine monooxygenase subunit DmmA family protein [Halalkalibacter alkaliphilus]MCL7748513.1 hypothetical protein [Halalkalibacter alkaliphilus]
MYKVKDPIDVTHMLSPCQKILLFVEEQYMSDSIELLEATIEQNIPFQLFTNKQPILSHLVTNRLKEIESNTYITMFWKNEINILLANQKIGTKLFIFGSWKMVNKLKRAALNQGFTNEDLYGIGYGEKEKNVYCIKCSKLNHMYEQINEIMCEQCQSTLNVSNHYSSRIDAYLGYLVI